MPVLEQIQTNRLLLRPWRITDRDAWGALNSDPQVMECFPSTLSRKESDEAADRIAAHFEKHGFGLWAVEIRGRVEFAGMIGLCYPRIETHFTPCVEIGWRLAAAYWNQGYTTEGAQGALAFGFNKLGLSEIVSYTATQNHRSRRVMEKLGMKHYPEQDFDHPLLAKDHPLARHVLYRIQRVQWSTSAADF